jgi:hypothetical protein
VLFLRAAAGDEVASSFEALTGPDDRFLVRGREVIWLRRGRLSDAPIRAGDLDRAAGGSENSMRKLTTLRRMLEKFGA